MKDSKGRFRTRSLFWETNAVDLREEYPPVYTLKDEDYKPEGFKETLPSARKIYLAQLDPTEYKAAQVLLGSWKHWQYMVQHCKWFSVKVEEWREELEVMLRSSAITEIANDSVANSRSSVASAKWLADKGWEKNDERGRPSKKVIAREAKIQGRIAEDLDEDIKRMQEFH